jgi:pimeloyl-ACP methyl ester carboxylesterase
MQLPANGLAFEVEDHGPPSGEPLVLIMGLGMQLVAWPDGLVQALVKSGFRVIRFDNRDIGLSQHLASLGVPSMPLQVARYALRLPLRPPYTLADMADDTAGLLDALGLASAHVCGASMGGMVAQHLARRHPRRLRSLTLMMTTSGARALPQPSWRVRQALLTPPGSPDNLPALVERAVRLYRLIGSPGYPTPEDQLRARVSTALQRSYRPDSVSRQLLAIVGDGDRSPWLGEIAAPVQIVHGEDDVLVPPAAAHDLKARLKGAELDLVPGMGHDLPQALWPRFAANVRSAAARA